MTISSIPVAGQPASHSSEHLADAATIIFGVILVAATMFACLLCPFAFMRPASSGREEDAGSAAIL